MAIYYKTNGERDYLRENEEHQANHARGAADTAFIHAIVWIIVAALSSVLGYLFALPFRYGYGKHFLWALFFLLFVAPVVATVAILAVKIHADPAVFLSGWQRLVVQHPGAASWTWAVRDLTKALAAI